VDAPLWHLAHEWCHKLISPSVPVCVWTYCTLGAKPGRVWCDYWRWLSLEESPARPKTLGQWTLGTQAVQWQEELSRVCSSPGLKSGSLGVYVL